MLSATSNLIGRVARAQLFSALDDDTLSRIATGAHLSHLAAGQYLWHAGDPAGEFHIIQSGLAEVQRVASSGEAVTLGLFGPGDALGTTAVLERGHYPADALALTAATEVLCVAAGPVLPLLEHSPALALAMNRALLAHTGILRAKINIVSAGSVPRRIAALVLYLVERFGAPHDGLHAHIGIELTREKIGQLVGCPPRNRHPHHEPLAQGGMDRLRPRWSGSASSGHDPQNGNPLDPMQSPTSALKLSTSEVSGMALARELTLIVRDSGIEHALCPVYPPGGRPAFMPAAEIPPVPGNLSRRGRDW